MADPNENFNRGAWGQAPPGGGNALDQWAAGNGTRQWNERELARQAGTSTPVAADAPFQYTAPPDPRVLNIGLLMAAAFVVFVFSVPIFGTLYPLAVGGAGVTGVATDAVLRHAAPSLDSSDRLPIEMLAGVLVFWVLSRLDHRVAARVRPYRYGRHVARLCLASTLTATACLNPSNGLVPTSPWQLHAIIANPLFFPVLGVAAIVTHLVLTKATNLRGMWDRGLEIFRLRPKDLG
jgi:hypothetical protein